MVPCAAAGSVGDGGLEESWRDHASSACGAGSREGHAPQRHVEGTWWWGGGGGVLELVEFGQLQGCQSLYLNKSL